MSADLQIVNCYDSTNCKDIFNCAPNSSSFSCPNPNPNGILNEPACPSGTNHLYCYGSDPNYCSGIIQQCDPNNGLYCKPTISNPAVNYFGAKLGCDVKTDPSCMEFENFEQCQTDCWDLGGSSEVYYACGSQFKDSDSCNAMKYFCKWNDAEKVCKNVKDDPWSLFQSGLQSGGAPAKIFTENVNGYTLNCAQSSWSSNQVTSYADTVRTCCISKPGTQKKCITTPRCQFVETTCECGFKDIDFNGNPSYNSIPSNPKNPWFICEDTEQSLTVNDNSFVQKGYCTWCKGSQLKNFDYRNWLINNNKLLQGEDIRDSIAWGIPNDCKNRCSNYNKCETNESEKQWNDCIWKHSGGTIGIDPNNTIGFNDFTKGFCFSSNCLANAKTQVEISECNLLNTLKNTCEAELAPQVSTINELSPITVNDNIVMAVPCSEGTNWFHSCTKSGNITYAQNYACGWCDNLQNDGNSCTNTSSQTENKWYSSIGNNQTTAIIAIIFIILFGIASLVGLGFVIRYIRYNSR
jgi:hypothetical protein